MSSCHLSDVHQAATRTTALLAAALAMQLAICGPASAEQQTLTLESVKCIKTTELLGSPVLVSAIGVLATGGFITFTSGFGAIPLATLVTAAGTSAGAKTVLEQLALTFTGSPDDLYINVGSDKVWPSGASRSIESQQSFDIGFETTFESSDGVTVSLWESDIAFDDPLGEFTIRDESPGTSKRVVVMGENAESIYEITYSLQ